MMVQQLKLNRLGLLGPVGFRVRVLGSRPTGSCF